MRSISCLSMCSLNCIAQGLEVLAMASSFFRDSRRCRSSSLGSLPAIDWDGQGWEGAGKEQFVSDSAGAGNPVFVVKDFLFRSQVFTIALTGEVWFVGAPVAATGEFDG